MTQTEWILDELKKGSVTAMQALEGCGCFRLAARIADLREQGHEIETKTLELNNGKRIAQYFFKKATNN
jgi:hypothetical protein